MAVHAGRKRFSAHEHEIYHKVQRTNGFRRGDLEFGGLGAAQTDAEIASKHGVLAEFGTKIANNWN